MISILKYPKDCAFEKLSAVLIQSKPHFTSLAKQGGLTPAIICIYSYQKTSAYGWGV